MWWSDPGADTHREWLVRAGLTIEHDEFVPEGDSGHQLFVATVHTAPPDAVTHRPRPEPSRSWLPGLTAVTDQQGMAQQEGSS